MYQIDHQELDAIKKIFESRKLFRYQGKGVPTHCSEFEREFAEYIGMRHALFVTSGTNALVLALRGLGLKKGDEVIVPSYTFVATISAVLQIGAVPVVASVGIGLSLDPTLLSTKLTNQTKAIILVHMDGVPADVLPIVEFAKKHSLYLIEDVAQAVGGSVHDKKLGSFGDVGCFSFNAEKIISCGEGGLVAFKDESTYKNALQLHDSPIRYGATFKEYLSDVMVDVGYSMRMSEISAVIMREQLKRLPGIIQRLRENRNQLLMHVKSNSALLVSSDFEGDCSTHIHFKLADPVSVGSAVRELCEQGVPSSPLYARPSHCFWMWEDLFDKKLTDLPWDRMHLSSIARVAVDFDASKEELTKSGLILEKVLSKYA